MRTSKYQTVLTDAGFALRSITPVTRLSESDEATDVMDALEDVLESHGITPEIIAETADGWLVAGETGLLEVTGGGVQHHDINLSEADDDDDEEEDDEEEGDEEDDDADESFTAEGLMDWMTEAGILDQDPDIRLVQAFDEANKSGNLLLMIDAATKLVEMSDVDEDQLDEYKKMMASAIKMRQKSAKKMGRMAGHARVLKKKAKLYARNIGAKMKKKKYMKKMRRKWESDDQIEELFGFGKKKAPAKKSGGNDLLKQQRERAARGRAKMASHRENAEMVPFVTLEATLDEADTFVDIADYAGLMPFVDVVEADDAFEVHIAEEMLEAIVEWADEDVLDEMETPGALGKISLTRFVGAKDFLKDAGPSGEVTRKNESVDGLDTPGSEGSIGLKRNAFTWHQGKPEGSPSPLTGLSAPKAVKPANASGKQARPAKHTKPHDYNNTYDGTINYTYGESVDVNTLRELNSMAFRADRDEVMECLSLMAENIEGKLLWSVAEDVDDNLFVLFFEAADVAAIEEAMGELEIELIEGYDLNDFLVEGDDEEDDEEEYDDDEEDDEDDE